MYIYLFLWRLAELLKRLKISYLDRFAVPLKCFYKSTFIHTCLQICAYTKLYCTGLLSCNTYFIALYFIIMLRIVLQSAVLYI